MTTMPVLFPMSREVFSKFASESNEAYAQDQVLAGTWAADEAVEKATAQFNQLLPRGIDTSDHFFYEVHDPSNATVGYLWFAVVGIGEAKAGYVYNIRIHPGQQRKGHGKAALLFLETIAAEMHLPAIRLNVFGHNPNAQTLYHWLGYEVTSSSMRKPLRQ